jgi:hypothetical protein
VSSKVPLNRVPNLVSSLLALSRSRAEISYISVVEVQKEIFFRIHRLVAIIPGDLLQFMDSGYPKGRKAYVVDHVVPLQCGGADIPSNMQWQLDWLVAKVKTLVGFHRR